MSVIFLDIDGVLNCDETKNERSFPYVVDRRLLENFKELLKRTGAQVVLSSSWRTDPIGLLAAKHYRVPFMDVCPDLPDVSRRDEIRKWLEAHPETDRYVVIDDDSDLVDDLPLFQPSSKTGLTMDLVEAIERYLKGETEETIRQPVLTRLGQNIHSMFKREKS
jgi:hypothetical protein